ncbi:immunity 26/phosphotriesterase HocA family protein [uncultured Rubinisphaera sp.]|uniref:immunity 26/phosphotriesterase HocA family protein n=1 Tax=uncultured Rubinisphaera sp. TaxID=1678686 RepID=UPI0030DD2CFD
MQKTKFRHGDIFAVPLPDGTYLPGRIMLDIYGCLKKRLFPEDSPLPGLGRAVAVEMYSKPITDLEFQKSEILIPGAYVDNDEFGNSWPIIGNNPVDPKSVQFPETLIGYMHTHGEVAFECGEISIPISMDLSKQREIGVYKSPKSTFLWPMMCLTQMDRLDLIPEKYRHCCGLSSSDLRYSKYRDMIYKLLPIKKTDTYYEQQKQLGLDFDRLYD